MEERDGGALVETLLCARFGHVVSSLQKKEQGNNADYNQDYNDQAALPFPDLFGRVDGVLDIGVGVLHVIRGRFHLEDKKSRKTEEKINRKNMEKRVNYRISATRGKGCDI